MSIICSFFTHAEDNLPKPWSGTWSALVEKLEETNSPRFRPKGDDPKKGLPAIAPATFEPLQRGKDAAQSLALLCLDCDNSIDQVLEGEFHKSGAPKTRKVLIDCPVTMDEVSEALRNADAAGYLWSTWSNRGDHPKFRAVVPLETPVPAALWEPATEWALAFLGLSETRRGLDLGALRDVARMYFLPGHPEGPEAIHRQQVTGDALAIPLEELSAIQVPEIPRAAQIRLKREHTHNAGHAWAGKVQVDLCTLRLADLIASLGVKVGQPRPYKTGTKWRTHCLWPDEHTHALDDDSGVVIHEPGRWPTWSCSHSCHLQLGLEDVLRSAGVIR